jgi:ATP-dependent Clp protease protease subunit
MSGCREQHTKNNGRVIYLAGEINEVTAQDISIEMLKMQREDPIEDITLIIDSYGGDMFAAFAIVDMMNILTCDVKTICVGKAMSAGQFIFSAGAKGKRYMTKHARLMIHNPSAGIEGSVPDIEVEIEELQRCRDLFVGVLVENSKLTREQMMTMISRNAYLNAEQGIEMGFADAIITRIK